MSRRRPTILVPLTVLTAALAGGAGYAGLSTTAYATVPTAASAPTPAPSGTPTPKPKPAPPKRDLTAAVTPSTGSVVGVGMPVMVRFGTTIRPSQRAAIERALVVKTTPTPVVGSWSWTGSREVHYRPRAYWPAHTTVQVRLALNGVRAGSAVWKFRNRTTTFTTGDAVVSKVDLKKHKMTVTRNGKTLMVIPVTGGKPGFTTRSGTKLIMEKYRYKTMDAATTGTPRGSSEYYRIRVQYAMRVTNSGEFLHAAPWSVASQGRANVSHGCVGMSVANAGKLYAVSRIGDPVVVTGTTRKTEPGNGWTDWNVSWAKWTAGSALS